MKYAQAHIQEGQGAPIHRSGMMWSTALSLIAARLGYTGVQSTCRFPQCFWDINVQAGPTLVRRVPHLRSLMSFECLCVAL